MNQQLGEDVIVSTANSAWRYEQEGRNLIGRGRAVVTPHALIDELIGESQDALSSSRSFNGTIGDAASCWRMRWPINWVGPGSASQPRALCCRLSALSKWSRRRVSVLRPSIVLVHGVVELTTNKK